MLHDRRRALTDRSGQHLGQHLGGGSPSRRHQLGGDLTSQVDGGGEPREALDLVGPHERQQREPPLDRRRVDRVGIDAGPLDDAHRRQPGPSHGRHLRRQPHPAVRIAEHRAGPATGQVEAKAVQAQVQPAGAADLDQPRRPAPIGEGDISFGTTLSYRSKTNQFEIPNPYIDQKGFALWDASLVYTAPEGRWSLGVFGKNLTDKHYKTSGYTFIGVNPVTGVPILGANGLPTSALGTEGTLTAFYGNPRQVFVTAQGNRRRS